MDIMLDLETLGTKPGCVILSIGAVVFDPKTTATFGEFYIEINTPDSVRSGLEFSHDTLVWWNNQDQQAKDLLERCEHDQSTDLYSALNELADWIGSLEATKRHNIWANDPSFDCRILEEAFDIKSLNAPWQYYNERSCRTMVSIGRDLGINPKQDIKFLGIAHNALDDAKHQVKYISAIHRYIHALEKPKRYEVKSNG